MFERSLTLMVKDVDGIIQWTLQTKRGRVVAMGAAPNTRVAFGLASKKLPRHSRIKKIEVEHE